MRVLHLDSGADMRGGQVQVVRLVEGLQKRGVECRLLARRGGALFSEAVRRGWNVAAFSLAHVMIDARRTDLVHAHDARSHTVAALAGGAPLVVARRVAFPIRSVWKYRRAKRVIAVSRYVAQILTSAGVDSRIVTVVPDGVPLLQWMERRSGVVAPANAADAAKGAAVVARAAELEEIDVKFSSDLEHDLCHAAVFVYITHSEGLGSGVLLAMSAGAAVVASDVGGIPEAVEHMRTGMLVDNTPHAVAVAIRQLLDKPEIARRIAECARRRVEEEFTAEAMVSRTIEVYRQVLA